MSTNNATNNSINGVNISGTPTTGQVPTATSGTAATWQTPAAGGGASTPKLIVSSVFSAYSGSTLDDRFDKASATSGSAVTLNTGATGLNLAPGNNTSYARVQMRFLGTATLGFDGNLEQMLTFADYVATTDTFQQFYGIGSITVSGSAGITMTVKHLGWYAERDAATSTYKYSCADGTTQNSGTYTGTSNMNTGYILKTGTTSVKYYYNGVLQGTLTTNIPTGSTQYPFCAAVSNKGTNANTTSQASSFTNTKELY